MTYNPLDEIVNEPLIIDSTIVERLNAYRARAKFDNLPGLDTSEERSRLSKILDDLTDRIIQGVESNATKLWVMAEFQRALVLVQQEDTEARDHFGMELEQLMEILGIESSDGLLACYLGGI